MKTKHTPTPWKVGLDNPMEVLSLHSHFLFKTSRSNVPRCEDIANAAHIVKCVNLFDELVEALDYTVQTHDTQRGIIFEKFLDLLRRAKGEL